MSEQKIDIKELLRTAVGRKASDLHISVDHRPTLRVMGRLGNIPEMKIITPQDSKELAFALMTEDQQEKFMKEKEIDFSYDFENGTRFRVNVYQQRGTISCSLRIVPTRVSTLEELNLPAVFTKFTEASQGLVLVTGPSSHGKSTTLAAMLDRINRTQFKRIITIEDPIEYIFQDDKSIIDQREINYDTFSFRQALKSVFRQDPDIIMVGEMRDAETIATVITAAETGHLVFSTLHTNSAAETINRIIDSFPGDQQNQIRSQLASSLIGVISQRLIPKKDGGLVAACEILMSTPATANIIRENRVHELDFVIETSAGEGMVSLNKALIHLIQKGKVSLDDALTYSRRPNELKKLIG
ncbi:MAG: type IV pilus twitching motility protein PilT [Candidatus Nealsonbacteria bacterium]|nr:type IV pilus twitching motility protein PilT [Candidatus Nealsonbacteria bacterium]